MSFASTITRVTSIVALSSVALLAQGTFTPIPLDVSLGSGVSGDGKIVVGSYAFGNGAWRWTQSGGAQQIGGTGSGAVVRISRDGSTITYTTTDGSGIVSAAIWQGGTNWKALGGIPGGRPSGTTLSTPYGVSADGSVIVGSAYDANGLGEAFRWDAKTGMVALPSPGTRNDSATAVSGNGQVVAGYVDLGEPTAWPRAGTMWFGGTPRVLHPFGWAGSVEAANDAGTALAGEGHPNTYNRPNATGGHAYLWLAGDGIFVDLGVLIRSLDPVEQAQLHDMSSALAMNADSSVVVGSSGKTPGLAFYWSWQTGMIPFTTFLRSKGITGWEQWFVLFAVGAVSDDGKVFVGTGIDENNVQRAFVVHVN